MVLHLYNTASKCREKFVPINKNRISMYLCGPTVYDFIHIGNARPLVLFDVLYRILRLHYGEVCYVRNITDVDDKINARATEQAISIADLADTMIQEFHADAEALNCLPPTHEPRATQHIEGMLGMIARLIENGHAYTAEGHVLFATDTMADYGVFAGMPRAQLLAGARVDTAPYKRNPQDFVLWKPSRDDLPGWENPWNERGRPGWHIECSAMSRHYLGGEFDLHMGGQDLIFPHHQNEIAQNLCAYPDESFARYWLHNGYVLCEGEKMSKSLGNFHTVRDLLAQFPGEALRLLLLQSHYRQPLDFSLKKLAAAKHNLDGFYEALDKYSAYGAEQETVAVPQISGALEEDLNTPKALAAWSEYLHVLNRDGDVKAYAAIRAGAELLGLLQQTPSQWLQATSEVTISKTDIEARIAERQHAKADKDFATADKIRDILADFGVILQDNPDGTTSWRNKVKENKKNRHKT